MWGRGIAPVPSGYFHETFSPTHLQHNHNARVLSKGLWSNWPNLNGSRLLLLGTGAMPRPHIRFEMVAERSATVRLPVMCLQPWDREFWDNLDAPSPTRPLRLP